MLSLVLEDSALGEVLQWVNVIVIPIGLFMMRWMWVMQQNLKSLTENTIVLPKMASQMSWLQREHEPSADGVQAWKNPGLAEAVKEQTDAIREMTAQLSEHAIRQDGILSTLLDGQREVKGIMRDKEHK